MYFCDLNNTSTKQEEKNKIKEQKLIACWWKYKNIKNFRFSKLMCSNIFESQRVGERPYGLTAQPALVRAQIDLIEDVSF